MQIERNHTKAWHFKISQFSNERKNTLFVGVKVEGILRQSADVEEVKHRFHDYEKGDFLWLTFFFLFKMFVSSPLRIVYSASSLGLAYVYCLKLSL